MVDGLRSKSSMDKSNLNKHDKNTQDKHEDIVKIQLLQEQNQELLLEMKLASLDRQERASPASRFDV